MRRCRRRVPVGFTLIELLVVIAVLSLLSALLFPVFARARERARQATCVSNLKQIGTAFQLYAGEEDIEEADIFVRHWPEWSARYLRSEATLACPTNEWTAAAARWLDENPNGFKLTARFLTIQGDTKTHTFDCADKKGPLNISYGFLNSGAGWTAGPDPPGLIPNDDRRFDPAGVLMFGETRLPYDCWPTLIPTFAWKDATVTTQPPDLLPPLPGGGALFNSHHGQSNWLFYDGHVKSLKVGQTLRDMKMWGLNVDPSTSSLYACVKDELAPEYR